MIFGMSTWSGWGLFLEYRILIWKQTFELILKLYLHYFAYLFSTAGPVGIKFGMSPWSWWGNGFKLMKFGTVFFFLSNCLSVCAYVSVLL